jgi:mono/diheme cytochrome c family protein
MTRTIAVAVIVLVAGGGLAGARTASATVDMQKKAKAAGFEVQNCLYCHGEKLPKKGAYTLNDRGSWLIAEKDKRKAKEIDVIWLKDYVEKKK